jgi:NhaA family Na+:H+ antiporter
MTETSENTAQTKRERLGGLLLIAAAILALALANSPLAGAYQAVLHVEIIKEISIFLFFFSVGIELRHEIRHGSLRNPRTAIVPVVAAMGGMLLPVIVYSVFNAGSATEAGWGIPMSTDIAFALAIFAIAGRALSKATRTFVMTVAVADDSLTILMIAVFFTASFNILSIISLAGVVAGLLIPGASRLMPRLGPIVSFGALPLFAFYSAGVSLSGLDVAAAVASPVAIGIVLAQLLGKPVGVLGTAWLVTKSRLGQLPAELSWRDLLSVGWLFAMCFTVSMLMVELSFPAVEGLTGNVSATGDPRTISIISVFVATTTAGLISTLAMRSRAKAIKVAR